MNAGRFMLAFAAAIILTLTLGAAYAPPSAVQVEPIVYAKPNIIREIAPIAVNAEPAEPMPTIEINARDAELIAQALYGEYRGEDKLQQAAVVWCILNRCDYYGESVKAIVTAPGQFHGYGASQPIEPRMYDIAVDVMTRWEREKLGEADVGRVLPKEYMWFSGDGVQNYFRSSFTGGSNWDWSLENPYVEG